VVAGGELGGEVDVRGRPEGDLCALVESEEHGAPDAE
jgi:hypothetical protein